MKEGKEILNLQRELNQLEGKKIIDLLLELDGTLYILEKNYDELLKIIVGYEDDDSIWDIENRKKFDVFFKELNRIKIQ